MRGKAKRGATRAQRGIQDGPANTRRGSPLACGVNSLSETRLHHRLPPLLYEHSAAFGVAAIERSRAERKYIVESAAAAPPWQTRDRRHTPREVM